MNEENCIEEIFYKHLLSYQFDEKSLDYSIIDNHKVILQTLSDIGNSGISVFDLCKREIVFYSANYGHLLGYVKSDYETTGQEFFASKIHPEDKLKLSYSGVSNLKIFDNFSAEDKLSHKLINEYRVLNNQNQYVRLIEQTQMLELDGKGQSWLMISFVDLSPNQNTFDGINSQIFNFKTGKALSLDKDEIPKIELTKREKEILLLVKAGYLSKDISSKLFISVHTVNTHRQKFLLKMGAINSFEAVNFASKMGILD